MKKLIAIAALATAAIATPALADTLTGEVRLGDVRGGARADSTEVKAEYWTSAYGLQLGAELQGKQAANAGAVDAKFSVKAGLAAPEVFGVHTLAYGEIGQAFKAGPAEGQFWGAGVKASRDLIGPVSVNAGYRHREGFAANDALNEERLHAGLGLAVTDKTALGATYYRTRGTTNSDAVGLSLTRKF